MLKKEKSRIEMVLQIFDAFLMIVITIQILHQTNGRKAFSELCKVIH